MERKCGEGQSASELALETMLSLVPPWQGKDIFYRPIFGGFSNSNWHVRIGGERQTFFLKMPGPGTEKFIDRSASLEAGRRAHELGIGPRIYSDLSDRGVEISDFVERSRPCTTRDFHSAEIRAPTINLFRTFNNSAPLRLTKTLFDMIDEHIVQLRELGAAFPHDFPTIHMKYRTARAALEASGLDIVPCCNDPAPANFLLTEDRILIVDLEYASNNDRCCDLATWCGEMVLSDVMQDEAIECYFGRVEASTKARMFVYQMLGDLKWSLWCMVQNITSSIDFDFYKYGVWKQMRLRSTLQNPYWDRALTSL
ncbi:MULTISPECIES: choline/ethanolamine kinase family protein [unclassified Mesorhizobium]|uniref:choline/ethanolamine kinase family protein n=1 Tax=unclassified Mesorhizobium TaxID=325217 RepID=UPI0011270BCE|nr:MULTISPECIES: choline/ethanolamine kinase family protein [unclassified Mesorhizobium]TPJ45987.1 phosphotransferase family protein [Mesorhizobium sp. B2-6-6]MCA0008476.1 phosphotransferase family protein [Mesorhizobium sp. B264B1B]MCA0021316.1 phosphotransferase family protein [Mesorhizobium sp. B264B1A]MCA0026327.1 phosphotransferase family protein [Mesorhizobium sp. B263B1A]MCA0056731.1 phosphotransferase family protein [Mesorhizobium sp. B261B1A]